jgi:hypothetical protein
MDNHTVEERSIRTDAHARIETVVPAAGACHLLPVVQTSRRLGTCGRPKEFSFEMTFKDCQEWARQEVVVEARFVAAEVARWEAVEVAQLAEAEVARWEAVAEAP